MIRRQLWIKELHSKKFLCAEKYIRMQGKCLPAEDAASPEVVSR